MQTLVQIYNPATYQSSNSVKKIKKAQSIINSEKENAFPTTKGLVAEYVRFNKQIEMDKKKRSYLVRANQTGCWYVCGKNRIEPIQILPEYKTEQAQRPKNFRTVILF